jgi:hypothetical protein
MHSENMRGPGASARLAYRPAGHNAHAQAVDGKAAPLREAETAASQAEQQPTRQHSIPAPTAYRQSSIVNHPIVNRQ